MVIARGEALLVVWIIKKIKIKKSSYTPHLILQFYCFYNDFFSGPNDVNTDPRYLIKILLILNLKSDFEMLDRNPVSPNDKII